MKTLKVLSTDIAGIKQYEDGRYFVDYILVLNGRRIHLYNKGPFKTKEDADRQKKTLVDERSTTENLFKFKKFTTTKIFKNFPQYLKIRLQSSDWQRTAFSIVNKYLTHNEKELIEVSCSYHRLKKIHESIVNSSILSEHYKNKAIYVFKIFFKYLLFIEAIDMDTHQNMRKLFQCFSSKKNIYVHQDINMNDIDKFIENTINSKEQLLFLFVLKLTIALREALALDWKDFNEKEKVLYVRNKIKDSSTRRDTFIKAPCQRIVQLTDKDIKYISNYKKNTRGYGLIFSQYYSPDVTLNISDAKEIVHKAYTNFSSKRSYLYCIRVQKALDEMPNILDIKRLKAISEELALQPHIILEHYRNEFMRE